MMCRWGVSHTSSEFKDWSHENGASKVESRCGEPEQEGVLASSDLAHLPPTHPGDKAMCLIQAALGFGMGTNDVIFCIQLLQPCFHIPEPFPRHLQGWESFTQKPLNALISNEEPPSPVGHLPVCRPQSTEASVWDPWKARSGEKLISCHLVREFKSRKLERGPGGLRQAGRCRQHGYGLSRWSPLNTADYLISQDCLLRNQTKPLLKTVHLHG